MKAASVIVALCTVFLSAGCGQGTDVARVERIARDVVARRSTTNEVVRAFGAVPYRIYRRDDAVRYLGETKARDTLLRAIWERMIQYPVTYSFAMPGGDAQVFIDESGRASAFYLNVQY